MDIFISKKMRNFILLAQTNNIARAAEKIHMTASPFGKSIAALEEQIGYTLFTRKDNNISLSSLTPLLNPVRTRKSLIFVNATMFDRYLPFSCPLNTFV
ncbi:helix-turn-helix domain-containing protein, partial [Shigella sonnei]|uniref:helix-turn-helix domain-containing protein n=1 Tax=Shigella sonnei TaxID=624 RepID=UPI000AA267B1